MANLLERSSLVLTPTAYNNGEALCIKPDDGSGDFDFSRNSAATRVNAQGLVENVQILSSNLVQNGDFSEEGVEEVSNGSFSQEGVEQVTNGDFATDTNWIGVNSDGVTISNGSLNYLNTPYAKQIIQTNVTTIGKTYKVTYTISNFVEGNIRFALGGNTGALRNANGTYTDYVTASVNNHLTFVVLGSPTTLSIDNVSVREVGQDWVIFGTGWSFGEDKIVSVNGSNYGVHQSAIVSGKTYKITYEVKDYVSGNFSIRANTVSGSVTASANGTYTDYITSNGTLLHLMGNGTFNGSVTNISVKEVGMDWALVGDFEVNNQEAYITNASQYSQLTNQIGVNYLLSGKKYKLEADIETLSISGALAYRYSGGAIQRIYTTDIIDGKFTAYFTMPQDGNFWFQTTGSYTGLNATITNISVIEITDDTNLPRINYENFSYQDALGSEEIVNGDFSNGNTGWSNSNTNGFSVSNGKLNLLDVAYTKSTIQFNVTTVGKIYKVTYEVSDYVQGSFRLVLGGTTLPTIVANGVYTNYVTATNDTYVIIQAFSGTPTTLSIDNVSVKEVTGQEVVPDSGCGSWLFEPQSTNLVPYSEDFSQWTANGGASVQSGFLAPDGTNNAYKVSGTGSSSLIFPSITNTTDTRTIYAKTVSGTGDVYLCGNLNDANALFTIKDQWQRFELNGFTGGGATTFYAVDFRGSSTLTEVVIWGAQNEVQSYATSYIPTSGSTVTRNQDVCTNGGSLATINSTEGVLYAEIASLSNEVPSNYISLSDGTYTNRISILYSVGTNIIRAFLRVGGAVQADMTFTVSDIRDFHKVAFLYKENNFALWIDGVEVSTDTSGSTMPSGTLSKLSFSEINTAGGLFRGKTKALAVWKEALSDSELQSLTTI